MWTETTDGYGFITATCRCGFVLRQLHPVRMLNFQAFHLEFSHTDR